MKVKCIKELSTRPLDYNSGKYYVLDEIYESKDFIFNKPETYYRIYDNYGDKHDFNKLGFETYFTSLILERKNKLEKLKTL